MTSERTFQITGEVEVAVELEEGEWVIEGDEALPFLALYDEQQDAGTSKERKDVLAKELKKLAVAYLEKEIGWLVRDTSSEDYAWSLYYDTLDVEGDTIDPPDPNQLALL